MGVDDDGRVCPHCSHARGRLAMRIFHRRKVQKKKSKKNNLKKEEEEETKLYAFSSLHPALAAAVTIEKKGR